MKRYLEFACFCCTLLLMAVASAKQDAAAYDGVVKIRVQRDTGPPEIGSGFVIRVEADLAYILTAKHVLEGARSINVFFRPRPDTAFVATVVHREQPEGFALLKVEEALPGGVRALPLAADVRLEPGDPVDVIGHSIEAGGDWSAPTGTVSGREGREIQLQVPVKKRNSGGPVLMQGSVVGVVFSEYGVGGKALSARAALEYAEGNRVTPQAGVLTAPPVVAKTPVVASPPVSPPALAPVARPEPPSMSSRPPSAGPFRECTGCPEMVVIPGGSFLMGSPADEKGRDADEGPQRRVQVASFAIGKTEVTFDQWDLCVNDKGCRHQPEPLWGRGSMPVMRVSWADAQEYAAWLSTRTGQTYRLPSEAEWEYAARARTKTAYPWGSEVGSNQANCAGCGSRWDGKQTAPVTSFAANRFGLHEMSGNVSEWVEDCYHDSYAGAPEKAWPAWAAAGCDRRVLRGGSWDNGPDLLRSAGRDRNEPGDRISNVGFRVARTLP